MGLAFSKDYLKSLACPSCGSPKLLLTKEKIFICQGCLHGYKLHGDIPDFRLENAISFKKKLASRKQGLKAEVEVMLGDDKFSSIYVKLGFCVVMGRRMSPRDDIEATMVGKPQDFLQESFVKIDRANKELIDKYLSQRPERHQAQNENRASGLEIHKKLLGKYERSPDFMLAEGSVSRSHAVVFQNESGLHILDLFSKNGTYVNGYEVEVSKLKDNDVISLGSASLRVRIH